MRDLTKRNPAAMRLLAPFSTALVLVSPPILLAQVFTPQESPPATPPIPARETTSNTTIVNKPEPKRPGNVLGADLPFFDPGSELVAWDGHNWNIANNRILQARFEKYLNAPAAQTDVDRAYRETLDAILGALSPRNSGGPDIYRATALMEKAASFDIDARLCDSLANAIYGVWLNRRNISSLYRANKELNKELRTANWNVEVATSGNKPSEGPSDPKTGQQKKATTGKSVREATRLGTYIKRVAEIEAIRTKNRVEMMASEIRQKLEFQSLIVQFFLQRRFEHVIISTRTYRKMFGDGDGRLQLEKGSEGAKMFKTGLGVNPTISTLDAFANEAIRDVDEGVQSFQYLVEKEELHSAAKRLMEAFAVGEYLPRIRTLPREEKRRIVSYVRDANQLISAIEVKDYKLAGELIARIRAVAKDFDYSKPLAAVETAKTLSDMRVSKAMLAAKRGDDAAMEESLLAAAEIYPTNPKLKDAYALIVKGSDIESQTLNDLDRLIAEGNYRTIFKDRGRFIAASISHPKRQSQLTQILTNLQRIDIAIMQADKIAESGSSEAAWEILEAMFREFPDDRELATKRSDLATDVADFVRTLRKARTLEERHQTGSSLAWYLKARQMHPASTFAREGIERLVNEILPDEKPLVADDFESDGNR